jgi:uncharacterized short protein YbdD (DUF466 family)
MPKVTISFNLPEEQEECRIAQRAAYYMAVIDDLDNYLRLNTKYAPEDAPEERINAFEEVRKKLHELQADNDL